MVCTDAQGRPVPCDIYDCATCRAAARQPGRVHCADHGPTPRESS